MKALTGKDLVKVLMRHGWRMDRIHGSHYILKKEGEIRAVTVPVHGSRTLKLGMQRAILKAAGVPED